jgi:hypothetical protein
MWVRSKTAVYALQALVWLAVLAASVFIVLTRRDEYGIAVYLVPAMAAAMLIIFVVVHLPSATGRSRLPELLGRASVLALIVGAIVALVHTACLGSVGLVARVVLLFFAFTFGRILIDYVKHPRRTPLEKDESAPPGP